MWILSICAQVFFLKKKNEVVVRKEGRGMGRERIIGVVEETVAVLLVMNIG